MTLTSTSQPKKETLFSTPKSHFASAAPSTAPTALPLPFTLHFTADIISQISAHLVRILTDFDGLGEESHSLVANRRSIKHFLTN